MVLLPVIAPIFLQKVLTSDLVIPLSPVEAFREKSLKSLNDKPMLKGPIHELESRVASWQSKILARVLRVNRAINFSQPQNVARQRAWFQRSLGISIRRLKQRMPDISVSSVATDGVFGEWIVPSSLGLGESQGGFEPNEIKEDGRYIIYVHGGGFCIGCPATHRRLAASLARACHANVLLLDYRLAPEHPFPEGLADVLRSYKWLLQKGILPSQILFGGESAGGNLVVASMLALKEIQVPLPMAAFIISPAMDLTQSGRTLVSHEKTDAMLSPALIKAWLRMYLGNTCPASPHCSPLFGELSDLPPMLVQAGSEEMLLDDSRRFCRLSRNAGNEVTLRVWQDMQHAWHFFAPYVPEGRYAIDEIGRFVDDQFARICAESATLKIAS